MVYNAKKDLNVSTEIMDKLEAVSQDTSVRCLGYAAANARDVIRVVKGRKSTHTSVLKLVKRTVETVVDAYEKCKLITIEPGVISNAQTIDDDARKLANILNDLERECEQLGFLDNLRTPKFVNTMNQKLDALFEFPVSAHYPGHNPNLHLKAPCTRSLPVTEANTQNLIHVADTDSQDTPAADANSQNPHVADTNTQNTNAAHTNSQNRHVPDADASSYNSSGASCPRIQTGHGRLAMIVKSGEDSNMTTVVGSSQTRKTISDNSPSGIVSAPESSPRVVADADLVLVVESGNNKTLTTYLPAGSKNLPVQDNNQDVSLQALRDFNERCAQYLSSDASKEIAKGLALAEQFSQPQPSGIASPSYASKPLLSGLGGSGM